MMETLRFVDADGEFKPDQKVKIILTGVIKGVERRPDYGCIDGPVSVGDEKKEKKPEEKLFATVEYSGKDLSVKRVGTEAQKGAKNVIERAGGDFESDDGEDGSDD